jgi:4-aminobutyrate--pyruvate transaminase
MSVKSNSMHARDVTHQLHPYTDAEKYREIGPLIIEHGEGIRVFDTDGKAYIEGLAGLWSVAVGFGEKRLVDAATEHLKKLPYYHSFAHKSHRPAIELAERLVSMTPQRANKVLAHRTASTSLCLSR